jgi:monoamine oxidase
MTAINNLGMGLLNKVYLRFPQVFWDEQSDLLDYIAQNRGEWAEWLNIYKYTGKPILLGFNAATYARQIEPLSDEMMVAAAMKTLRTIHGPSIPEPEAWLITRWASDPLAGGSYSYLPPGASPDDYDDLAEPVADRLFFAGEATSREYAATVHGAYLSGLAAAERIVNR